MSRDIGQLTPSRCFGACEREQFQERIAELELQLKNQQHLWKILSTKRKVEITSLKEQISKMPANRAEVVEALELFQQEYAGESSTKLWEWCVAKVKSDWTPLPATPQELG